MPNAEAAAMVHAGVRRAAEYRSSFYDFLPLSGMRRGLTSEVARFGEAVS
jgi:hypothetical protein